MKRFKVCLITHTKQKFLFVVSAETEQAALDIARHSFAVEADNLTVEEVSS